jgi:hypothetical protein
MGEQELTTLTMDQNETREIPMFPGFFVTRDGRVRGKRVDWLKHKWTNGRPFVHVWMDGRAQKAYIHLCVLSAWDKPRPVGMEACHNDGDKTNNHISNLRWDTRSANMIDRLNHGQNPIAKLDTQGVIRVRELLKEGVLPQREIADMFDVNQSQISRVNTGDRWTHVHEGVGSNSA